MVPKTNPIVVMCGVFSIFLILLLIYSYTLFKEIDIVFIMVEGKTSQEINVLYSNNNITVSFLTLRVIIFKQEYSIFKIIL